MKKAIVSYFCNVSTTGKIFDEVLGEFSILQDLESKTYSIKATVYLLGNWLAKTEEKLSFTL